MHYPGRKPDPLLCSGGAGIGYQSDSIGEDVKNFTTGSGNTLVQTQLIDTHPNADAPQKIHID